MVAVIIYHNFKNISVLVFPCSVEPGVKDFNDEVPGIFSRYGVFNKKVFLLAKCIIWMI